jgi:Pentapeptide repeats (8 copies)
MCASERASLYQADLRGALLLYAQLQGASLQGADLNHAQLQGSDLTGTELDAANTDSALVWRTRPPHEDAAKQVWGSPIVEAKLFVLGCGTAEGLCDWTPASFAAPQASIATEVPPSFGRDQALRRIAVLQQPSYPLDPTVADRWAALSDPHLARAEYLAALASILQKTEEISPEAVAGLIQQLDLRFKANRRRRGSPKRFSTRQIAPARVDYRRRTRRSCRKYAIAAKRRPRERPRAGKPAHRSRPKSRAPVAKIAFPAERRDPRLPWAPAFAGEARSSLRARGSRVEARASRLAVAAVDDAGGAVYVRLENPDAPFPEATAAF